MRTRILYEDDCLLVCHKPSGLATQTERIGQADVVSELKNYLKSPYLGIIHRLDQPVEGVLVFGKTKDAAAALSRQVTEHTMSKKYLALVYGVPCGETGSLVDYLVKEAGGNLSRVADKKERMAKRAELSYRVLQSGIDGVSVALLEIDLRTGRHHQIRVQLSHAGFPLLGDSKYGTEQSVGLSAEKGISSVALCAYELEFLHPGTKKTLRFCCTDSAAFCEKRGFCLT